MCKDKKHGGKRCSLGRPTQADRAVAYVAAKQSHQSENEVQRVITHLYRAERAENTDARQLLSEDAKMAFITEQELETQKMNISPSAKRTGLRRWMRARFENLTAGKKRSLKRVLQVTTGVGMVALMTACGASNTGYTAPDSPIGTQATVATPAPTHDAPTTVAGDPGSDGVVIPADVAARWGDSAKTAAKFASDALWAGAGNADGYAAGSRTIRDFVSMQDFMTSQAWDKFQTELASGDQNSFVGAIVPYAGTNQEQMKDGTKFTLTPDAIPEVGIVGVPVLSTKVGPTEDYLVYSAISDMTVTGTTDAGATVTQTYRRALSYNLVQSSTGGWLIESVDFTGTAL